MSIFAALIENAQINEAAEAAQAATAKSATAKEVGLVNARHFGHAVQARLVKQFTERDISSADLIAADEYATAMLSASDVSLPPMKGKQKETLRREIDFVFIQELERAHNVHRGVPKGMFNGQRVLDARAEAAKMASEEKPATESAQPERIRIPRGVRPRGPRANVVHTSTTPLPAAFGNGPAKKAKVRPGSNKGQKVAA